MLYYKPEATERLDSNCPYHTIKLCDIIEMLVTQYWQSFAIYKPTKSTYYTTETYTII